MRPIFVLIVMFCLSLTRSYAGDGTTGGGDHIRLVIENAKTQLVEVMKFVNKTDPQNYPTYNFLDENRKKAIDAASKFFNEHKDSFKQNINSLAWDFPTPWPYNPHLSAYTNPDDPSEPVHFNLDKLNKSIETFSTFVAKALIFHEMGHKLGFKKDDSYDQVDVESLFDIVGPLVLNRFGSISDRSIINDFPIVRVGCGRAYMYFKAPANQESTKACRSNGSPVNLTTTAEYGLRYRMGEGHYFRGKIIDKYICEDGRTYYGVALYPNPIVEGYENVQVLEKGDNSPLSTYMIVSSDTIQRTSW